MNGLDKIHSHILSEAQAEMEELRAMTEKRREGKLKEAAARAQDICAGGDAQRGALTAQRKERLRSSAEMEARQQLLACKQELLDETFSRAGKSLRELPREQYIDLLGEMAAHSGRGGEEIILDAAERDTIGAAVVARANAIKPGFTLSDETRELGGGLVLKSGKLEWNCSFDTVLQQLRQDMAAEIAHTLFD